MSFLEFPRGPCQHAQCALATGGCAGFLVLDNDTVRMHALTPDEPCSACAHPYFSHRILDTELAERTGLLLRGACPPFECGGFVLPASATTANWDTQCACGGLLRAHAMLAVPGSRPLMSMAHMAPPQFATTHPPPPLRAHALPTPARSTSAALASSPPLEAYAGKRPEVPGSTWDRRNASAMRARPAAQRGNAPRARTASSVVHGPTDACATSSTRAMPAVHASPSSFTVPVSPEDPDFKTFTVMLFPYQHPDLEPHMGSYPHTEFVWTQPNFVKLARQLVAYKLVFTVSLRREGPVWQDLGKQVVDYCDRNLIVLPDVPSARIAEDPTTLPFAVMRSAAKRKPKGARAHEVKDELDCTRFTVKNLMAKAFTTPAYPLEHEQFAPHPLLRLVPRAGDLKSNMMRLQLWSDKIPGMSDYLDIPAGSEPHPCFPARVMCAVDEDIVPRCRPDCPTDGSPSPPGSPVAGPSNPLPAPSLPARVAEDVYQGEARLCRDDGLLTLLSRPGSSSSLPPPSHRDPAGPAPLTGLQLSGLTDDTSSTSSSSAFPSPEELLRDLPPPPVTRLSARAGSLVASATTSGLEPIPSSSSLQSATHDVPMAAPEAVSNAVPAPVLANIPESAPGYSPAPSPARAVPPPALVQYGTRAGARRSARMTPGGRAPAPVRRAQAEARAAARAQSNSSAPDKAGENNGAPPTNRRRTHSPLRPVDQADLPHSGPPLRSISEAAMKSWQARVLSSVKSEPDLTFAIPHIVAPDVEVAARILLFQVEWLIKRRHAPIVEADAATFQNEFSSRFPQEGVECHLTSLSRLLLHAANLDLTIGVAIGSSPIRTVLRRAIEILVSDQRYWHPVGKYFCMRSGPTGVSDRDDHLATCGFMALMHMIGVGRGPDPMSPFALRYAIEGRDRACVLDPAFIRLIDPMLYAQLAPWAEYEWGSPLPKDPAHKLNSLIFSAGKDTKVFSDPPRRAELEWMERHLVASAVFDAAELASDGSSVASFAEGMHVALAPGRSLDTTFLGRSRDYLAVLCNARLESVQELLRKIKPRSTLDRAAIAREAAHSETMTTGSWDAYFEDVFEARLARYLTGLGHPNHPDVREVIGDDMFARDSGDPLLRARLFLHMMTGSDLVPDDKEWLLKIFFVHRGRRDPPPPNQEAPIPHPIEVHSCFYDCTVHMDDGLRNLLRENHPGLSFEAWLHGALMNPQDYNQV
ncbi:hypothetical protein K466DRAFT_604199 [Polyporus arcularius HHB13444]|uniref:Uncharacterized protein n=1 Tax=Polyporus arcularius HHB13444 TaxID=1314778 RepID=A0A5C3P7R5_9APHY|nr:hypothetical protein K466DRAFT_604199 [Polyporus arcularius HHB13444]